MMYHLVHLRAITGYNNLNPESHLHIVFQPSAEDDHVYNNMANTLGPKFVPVSTTSVDIVRGGTLETELEIQTNLAKK